MTLSNFGLTFRIAICCDTDTLSPGVLSPRCSSHRNVILWPNLATFTGDKTRIRPPAARSYHRKQCSSRPTLNPLSSTPSLPAPILPHPPTSGTNHHRRPLTSHDQFLMRVIRTLSPNATVAHTRRKTLSAARLCYRTGNPINSIHGSSTDARAVPHPSAQCACAPPDPTTCAFPLLARGEAA